MRPCWSLLTVFVFTLSWPASAEQLRCPAHVTHMDMEKGQYSPMPGAIFALQNFSADMVARGKTMPACFARINHVQHGEVFISAESLTKMFERKLTQSNSQIKDVSVEFRDDGVHLKGKAHKGVDVPFELEGPISTDGSKLVLQVKKIKAEKLPVKGLLGMLGVHLSSLIGSGSMDGVSAQEDKLLFDPLKMAQVSARLARVEQNSKGMTITFAPEQPEKKPVRQAGIR